MMVSGFGLYFASALRGERTCVVLPSQKSPKSIPCGPRPTILAAEAHRDGAIRQQKLIEVRLSTESHEHLNGEAVVWRCSGAAGIIVALRAVFNRIHLSHHVLFEGADGGADDRGAAVLEALPVNQQRGIGITETTLAAVRGGLPLRAAGFIATLPARNSCIESYLAPVSSAWCVLMMAF